MIRINQYLECIDDTGRKIPYCDAMKQVRHQLGFETMVEFAASIGCKAKTLENYFYGKTENPPLMVLGKIKRMLEEKEKKDAR